MAPSKAPGVDSFNTGFYQRFWDVVSKSVIEMCLGILNGFRSMKEINHTLIVLIPKVERAVKIGKFRPISLCNVIYKIVSKVLANRLRGVLGKLISETQSAFILGRSIMDNAIVGFKCMHALKRKRKGKMGFLGLKLDMAKMYDRVEWRFIQAMLQRLGFPPGWTRLIMECISSVKYSVLINGEAVGMFYPSRGLRQGDLLSPYLFLLCAEGLSSLICSVERSDIFSGLRCSRSGPKITHLFFADDSLIFTKANVNECLVLKEFLLKYELAMLEFLWAAKARLKSEVFLLLCVSLWRVWHRRNRVVHGQLLLPAGGILEFSVSHFTRKWYPYITVGFPFHEEMVSV
ncbi:hypothetical protein ACOSP7_014411 [Xanthoceras sorbifolium]